MRRAEATIASIGRKAPRTASQEASAPSTGAAAPSRMARASRDIDSWYAISGAAAITVDSPGPWLRTRHAEVDPVG
jgi:hypothetical protein